MPPTTVASTPESCKVLRDPVNLSHYLSATARRRKANAYKLFYKYYDIPGLQDISGGLPNASLFPFDSLSGQALSSDRLENPGASDIHISASHKDLEEGLQYGQATGLPEMEKWVAEFTEKYIAQAPYAGGFKTLLTMGSTDGWNKVLQVLSDEWRDTDPVSQRSGLIVEEFTYALAAEVAVVRGLTVTGVKIDEKGIVPSSLRDTLENWDSSKGKRPHLLYTISIGQNPTGATVPSDRRREIYEICCAYDVVIVEDEPYWWMQYDVNTQQCYLPIDVEGRVIRLDSFSKCFAPGCRMGWVTAQPELLRRIFYLAEEATQMPSGFTQLMVYKTLSKWGQDGWWQWLRSLRDEYKSRRDEMVLSLSRFDAVDGERVLEFSSPQAGMFVWVKIRFDLHPLRHKFSNMELSQALWVFNTQEPDPTLVNPGYMFAPVADNAAHMANFFRMSFAPSPKQVIAPAAACVGRATQSFWKLDAATIRRLADKFPKS